MNEQEITEFLKSLRRCYFVIKDSLEMMELVVVPSMETETHIYRFDLMNQWINGGDKPLTNPFPKNHPNVELFDSLQKAEKYIDDEKKRRGQNELSNTEGLHLSGAERQDSQPRLRR